MSEKELETSINTYFPFLVEARKRLLFLASIFLVAGTVGFIYYEKIVNLAISIFKLEGVNIVFTSPFQFINLAINSGVLVGLLVLFPFVIIQLLSFIRPALRKKEYRLVVALLPLSILLFIGGFAFGVLIMKWVVVLFYKKSMELNVGNLLDINLLLSQILVTAAFLGLAFQYPIVLTILMRLKIIKYTLVAGQRLIAWAAAIVFAALMPPTDLLSLVLLALPLVILFELTLILNRVFLQTHLM